MNRYRPPVVSEINVTLLSLGFIMPALSFQYVCLFPSPCFSCQLCILVCSGCADLSRPSGQPWRSLSPCWTAPPSLSTCVSQEGGCGAFWNSLPIDLRSSQRKFESNFLRVSSWGTQTESRLLLFSRSLIDLSDKYLSPYEITLIWLKLEYSFILLYWPLFPFLLFSTYHPLPPPHSTGK